MTPIITNKDPARLQLVRNAKFRGWEFDIYTDGENSFYAISDGEPKFCLWHTTDVGADKLARDALNMYWESRDYMRIWLYGLGLFGFFAFLVLWFK
jgi:hypothetical protein